MRIVHSHSQWRIQIMDIFGKIKNCDFNNIPAHPFALEIISCKTNFRLYLLCASWYMLVFALWLHSIGEIFRSCLLKISKFYWIDRTMKIYKSSKVWILNIFQIFLKDMIPEHDIVLFINPVNGPFSVTSSSTWTHNLP